MDRVVWVAASPRGDSDDVRSVVSAALEVGFDEIVLFQPDASLQRLGRFSPILLKDSTFFLGDVEVGRLATIRSAKDEAPVRGLRGATKNVVIRPEPWKVIPLENLIAFFQGSGTRLLVEVHDVTEAKLAFETMEVGAGGIFLTTSSRTEIRAVRALLESFQQDIRLIRAKITGTRGLGLGDRVCVDTCSLLRRGEGLLVGNTSAGLFLIHAETIETGEVAARPFRVNAGPVHAYIYLPGGPTKDLSELRAGDDILAVDSEGRARSGGIGRGEIQRRPPLLVELRLDEIVDLGPNTIRHLAKSLGEHAIATNRSPGQGGAQRRGGAPRSALMKEICGQRFAYVDLELEEDGAGLDVLARVAHDHGTRVILSHPFAQAVEVHRASETLEACAAPGDIAKVVTPVADFEAAIQLIDVARVRTDRPRPMILIGTGPAGMVTRALADALDQEIQYASWGNAAAPGQLPLATAARLRGREPIILGLVGHPLEHSLSPLIHETALAALHLPAVYLPFDIPLESLDQFLLAVDRLRIRGFNVTHPLKESLAQRVDELDADAERLGAVNTVVVQDSWTVGHNTDVYGFRVSLRALGLRVGDRTALVVGAGGAARAVVHVLLREGASVQVTNRTIARAEALADSFDDLVAVVPMETLQRAGPWDLLVNATPIGMKGAVAPGLPVPEAIVAKAAFVYDLVYNPTATPLLQAAQRLNRPGTSGLDMLLHQAAKAFELWTGQSSPFDAMRRAAKEALR